MSYCSSIASFSLESGSWRACVRRPPRRGTAPVWGRAGGAQESTRQRGGACLPAGPTAQATFVDENLLAVVGQQAGSSFGATHPTGRTSTHVLPTPRQVPVTFITRPLIRQWPQPGQDPGVASSPASESRWN